METQTFVKFWFQGAFFDEDSNKQVNARDIGALDIPARAYALEFYDIRVTTDNGVVLKSAPLNKSPRFFVGGRVMTYDEVVAEEPDSPILIDNMRINRWAHVIKTRVGHFQPFSETDVLLSNY